MYCGTSARLLAITNDSVRLAEDFPELGLQLGDEGIVRSAWHYPNVAYEVEFQIGPKPMGVLLMANQVMARPSEMLQG